MQYSKKIVPQQKYENFGIWNIPKKQDHNKNMKILEYGIFQEYSINNVPQQKNENFGIWNIPRIFKKNRTTTKISKFWNMEYSMEFSWNIPKKVSQRAGA